MVYIVIIILQDHLKNNELNNEVIDCLTEIQIISYS